MTDLDALDEVADLIAAPSRVGTRGNQTGIPIPIKRPKNSLRSRLRVAQRWAERRVAKMVKAKP